MSDNAGGAGWAFGPGIPGVPGNQATGTMTGTNKINGNPLRLEKSHGAAWTMRWTGTPTGSFTVEVSNEFDPDTNPAAADWTTYSLTKPAGVDPTGGAGNSGIDLAPTSFKWARLCYTNAAGVGTLISRQMAKGY